MKIVGSLILLFLPALACAQSLFAEANFSDMQFTALVKNNSLQETELGDPFSGFALYLAETEILDVYFGDLSAGDEIEIQIYVAFFGRKNTLGNMSGPYILSFCQSKDGIFFTNRDFLVLPDSPENLQELKRLTAEGTEFDGKNDCASTNFDLKPVIID